ncbi:MAG: hypothetical protein NTV51_03850, partial [Verrucomicrobia bacterium]|nr:hypothetical protein [Verrucomicrobiota bacterium]
VEVHEVLRARLSSGLEERPGIPPSDSVVLDKYERMVDATRLAGRMQEAFGWYWVGMGNYSNLRHRLGQIHRGFRLLSAFVLGGGKRNVMPGITERDQSALLCDLGLFSLELGELRFSLECIEASMLIDRRLGDQVNDARGCANVSGVFVRMGELARAATAAEEAVGISLKMLRPVSSTHFLSARRRFCGV